MNAPTPLLKIRDVAEWLRLKESTIRKWVCYGRIPYLKVGRNVCFRREDVEAWLQGKRSRSTAENHCSS